MIFKFLRIFLLLLTIHLYGDEYMGKPEKPLTLSKNIPIEMNNYNEEIEERDLREEPTRNVRISHRKTFPWGKFLSLLIAVITLIILKFLPREKKLEKEERIAPGKKAKNRLQSVREQHLPPKEFYAKILYILKLYVEERYQINAPAKTTEEFLCAFKMHELFEKMPENTLNELLKLADLVKYAKVEPTDLDCEQAVSVLQTLIQQK